LKKVLLSLLSITAVGILAFGASRAFFNDMEKSTGNSFTAGKLDLIVNIDGVSVSNRSIFNEPDIKPGDQGEKTLDMIVIDNPSCGTLTFTLNGNLDKDNSCTEPEAGVEGPNCPVGYYINPPNPPVSEGELNENMIVTVWEDSGMNPGWQCGNTPGCAADVMEGDNIKQANEHVFISQYLLGNFSLLLGELPANTPFYYGFKWEVPSTVGNIIQSDSFAGFFDFNAYQKRNWFPNGCWAPSGQP